MKAEEDYKRIKGFEQEYLISNYGRVIRIFKNGNYKEKKQSKNHNGYYRVNLWKNNKFITLRVSRLVAEHFIENVDPFLNTDVHHKDENKANNYFENLEWCTHNENLYAYYSEPEMEEEAI